MKLFSIFIFIFCSSAAVLASTITDEKCIKIGFDCAVDNQCVINGTLKPGASTVRNYESAISDVAQNPSHYSNWPNVFNTCDFSSEVEKCQQMGFDCYLNNQCVVNGSIKLNSTSSSDYKKATADVAQNPSRYIFWSNIFNVCPK